MFTTKYFKYLLIIFVFACFVAGCVVAPSVGSSPSQTPPRIIVDKDSGKPSWDNPSAFGPVPTNLQVSGDAVCELIDKNLKAIGFHPNAIDIDGNKFPEGGYYCFYKKK